MVKVKRFHFVVNCDGNEDSYISDELHKELEHREIYEDNIVSIQEKETDGLFKIIVYYKEKND